jgi:hypothetical protein
MTVKRCEEKLLHPIPIVIDHDPVQVKKLKRFFVEVLSYGNVNMITYHAERPMLFARKAMRLIIAIL